MRFSVSFVIICAFIPFIILIRENQQRGSDAPSIWWLKVGRSEEFKWLLEESEIKVEESKKLSRWAQQQRDVAILYSNNFGLGAFCRIPLRLPLQHQQQHNQFQYRREKARNIELGPDPIAWDASLSEHGSIINIIITSGSNLGISANARTVINLNSNSRSSSSSDSSSSSGESISSTLKGRLSMPTRVSCRLYDHRSQLLATVTSLPIIDDTLVRCPVPYNFRKLGLGSEVKFGVKLMWPEKYIHDTPSGSIYHSSSGSSGGGIGMGGLLKAFKHLPSLSKAGVSSTVPSSHLNQTLNLTIIKVTDTPQGFGPTGGHGMAFRKMYSVCPLAIEMNLKQNLQKGTRTSLSSEDEGFADGRVGRRGTGGREIGHRQGHDLGLEEDFDDIDAGSGDASRRNSGSNGFLRGQLKDTFSIPTNTIISTDSESITYEVAHNVTDPIIIPEILPGWNSALTSNKLSPLAFPSDTTHTYALSICTATSRGSEDTSASVRSSCGEHKIKYNIIQYYTIQYNTIQYNTIQCNTIQYNTIQCNTIQYNTIQYDTILYYTILYYTILYYTTLYYTIQYNTIQYNTIQYNTIQYNTIRYDTIRYDTSECDRR